MNAPERYELYLVPEGVKKVSYEFDRKMPNAIIIKVEKEDHTLGNMLRGQLLQDEKVLFAGYRVEHPLDHSFILRVQTVEGYDPKDAVTSAARMLLVSLDKLRLKFEQEWELRKISAEGEDVEY